MESKKSILENLADCYDIYLKMGSKGYAIGFYNELHEEVKESYSFPEGKYTLSHFEDNFLLFSYKSEKSSKNNTEKILTELKESEKLKEFGEENSVSIKMLSYGEKLEKFPEEMKKDENLVTKCMSTVFLAGHKDGNKMKYFATSNSAFVRSELYIILSFFRDMEPKEIISQEIEKEYKSFFEKLNKLIPMSIARTQGFEGAYERIVKIAIKNI